MIFLICVIITLSILFFMLWLAGDDTKQKVQGERELLRLVKDPLSNVKYLTGHPNLDHSDCFNIEVQDYKLIFFGLDDEFVAAINGQFITEISVCDKSVLQERVTLGRVALLGLWALAAPKREKIAICHLVITWQDEHSTRQTAFEYNGYEPLLRADRARDTLVRELKNSSLT